MVCNFKRNKKCAGWEYLNDIWCIMSGYWCFGGCEPSYFWKRSKEDIEQRSKKEIEKLREILEEYEKRLKEESKGGKKEEQSKQKKFRGGKSK